MLRATAVTIRRLSFGKRGRDLGRKGEESRPKKRRWEGRTIREERKDKTRAVREERKRGG